MSEGAGLVRGDEAPRPTEAVTPDSVLRGDRELRSTERGESHGPNSRSGRRRAQRRAGRRRAARGPDDPARCPAQELEELTVEAAGAMEQDAGMPLAEHRRARAVEESPGLLPEFAPDEPMMNAARRAGGDPAQGDAGPAAEPVQGVAARPEPHFCPVVGCTAAAGGRRPPWPTFAGLRAHVDAHLLGQLPGLPSQQWLQAQGLVGCRVCGRLVSTRCNGGVHRTCLAHELLQQPVAPEGVDSVADDLPSLDDIMLAPIATREFVGSGLLPAVEREFNKCGARVLAHSRIDAWDHEGQPTDTPAHAAARRAWAEWFMFAKTVARPSRREEQRQQESQSTGGASRTLDSRGTRVLVGRGAAAVRCPGADEACAD